MEAVYLAFVDTPGIFSAILHRYLKQKYIHVVLSLDPCLEEAYSFGRRNPAVPLLAGFEKEDKEKIWRVFPEADYQICRIACTKAQKEQIRQRLNEDYRRRFRMHYAVAGLLFIFAGRPSPFKKQFTCSSYVAKLFEDSGVLSFEKHYSLVTPKDFYEYGKKEIIFEGKLEELLPDKDSGCKLTDLPLLMRHLYRTVVERALYE